MSIARGLPWAPDVIRVEQHALAAATLLLGPALAVRISLVHALPLDFHLKCIAMLEGLLGRRPRLGMCMALKP